MSDRIRILHLVGVCDSHTVMLSRLSRDPRNLPMHFEGNVEITALVDEQFEVVGMLCGDLPTDPFRASPFDAVLNGICDPDTNAGALRAAAGVVDQLGVGGSTTRARSRSSPAIRSQSASTASTV